MIDKIALFLMAGPEMPCRVVHTFIWALDVVARGGEAKIVLEGEAPKWLLALPNPKHPHHGLYNRVKKQSLIDAVCKACAIQNGALEATEEEGFRLVNDATGHVSLVPYSEAGYHIVTV
jgi:hypothetical protein